MSYTMANIQKETAKLLLNPIEHQAITHHSYYFLQNTKRNNKQNKVWVVFLHKLSGFG